MAQQIPKIYFVTNIAPMYRANLLNKLSKHRLTNITFFFGLPKNGVQQIDFRLKEYNGLFKKSVLVKNIWVRKSILIWQSKIVKKSITDSPDMVILLGEFSIISNWIAALIYRFRGIKIIIYGHGLYGNEKGLKLALRKSYLKLGDGHLVYEKHGKNMLVEKGFEKENIHIFYNSLDYEKQVMVRKGLSRGDFKDPFHFFKTKDNPTIVFVGRLTEEKKLEMLIHLCKNLRSKGLFPNLLLIGKGPMGNELKELAQKALPDGSFHFFGPCYEEETLGNLIFNSDLCVSPGNVGLTAIHALTYGTPVATHSNLYQQGPEVEAIIPGHNGFLFEQHNLEDLTTKTAHWLTSTKDTRTIIRENCYEVIEKHYNPHQQIKVFNRVVEHYL